MPRPTRFLPLRDSVEVVEFRYENIVAVLREIHGDKKHAVSDFRRDVHRNCFDVLVCTTVNHHISIPAGTLRFLVSRQGQNNSASESC